ncbi:MAG TPA: MOSC domain-containing protein [Myxococcales bacterium]|nr:MOSC domain-containing protein [Myxococcales bacterium]
MRIAGVQAGRGFGKQPVRGPVRVGAENVEGDKQMDRRYHGGPDKAVLAYSADHYPLWRAELSWPDLPFGGFAENLSVEGVTEDTACVGDVWRAGTAVLQISSPRFPCIKIPRFWRRPALLERVVETGRTGWYMRVLEPGVLQEGDEIALLERGAVTVRCASES